MTGLEVVHVAYKGSAPSAQAMLAGEAQTMMMTLVDALPHIRSGKLRAIAATTATRIPELPDVPTLAETAMPGFDYAIWNGLYRARRHAGRCDEHQSRREHGASAARGAGAPRRAGHEASPARPPSSGLCSQRDPQMERRGESREHQGGMTMKIERIEVFRSGCR